MEQLRDKELSTSRIKWFRNLYCQLSDEDSPLFLNDLSKEVEMYYSDSQDGDELDEFLIACGYDDRKQNVQILQKDVLEQPKKIIFISYCWEDEEH